MTKKEKAKRLIEYAGFPDDLGDLDLAVPFEMLNYDSIYIRVKTSDDTKQIKHTLGFGKDGKVCNFNDDGYHVPIVDMADGHLFWMAKQKPCRVVQR